MIEESKAINSKIVSLKKLLILLILQGYGKDEATFSELISGLGLKEGVFQSHISLLIRMGYVKQRKVPFNEKKKLTVYSITPSGELELERFKKWFYAWAIKKGDENGKNKQSNQHNEAS